MSEKDVGSCRDMSWIVVTCFILSPFKASPNWPLPIISCLKPESETSAVNVFWRLFVYLKSRCRKRGEAEKGIGKKGNHPRPKKHKLKWFSENNYKTETREELYAPQGGLLEQLMSSVGGSAEQCKMVVFVADDLLFLGARDSGPRDTQWDR